MKMNLFNDLASMIKESTAQRQSSDMLSWCKYYLADHISNDCNDMHKGLCDIFEKCYDRKLRKVLRKAPRGYGKSTWVSCAFPLRGVVEGKFKYIMIVSDTLEQAQMFLSTIKDELTENHRIATDYPDAFGKGSTWTITRIKTRNGVLVEALGTGQKPRGRKNRNVRPDLIICDDLQGNEDVVSEDIMNK